MVLEDAGDVRLIADDIVKVIRDTPFSFEGMHIPMTVSLGASLAGPSWARSCSKGPTPPFTRRRRAGAIKRKSDKQKIGPSEADFFSGYFSF